ncbi:restriction endonuclease [Thalassotalea montiporae]
MWQFKGEIEFICNRCSSTDTVPLEYFYRECIGGSERQMGEESVHELSYNSECSCCSNEIELAFEVSEYPVNVINFIIDKSCGAQPLNEPDVEYIREIFSARDLFELYNTIPELIAALKADSNLLSELEPREFEEVTAEIFRAKGFEVELTKRTRDGGKDVIALHRDKLGIKTKYIIECKHYAESNKVGVDVIRSLYGVVNSRSGGNVGIVVTTSSFTSGAIDFVENETTTNLDLSLADRNQLVSWLEDY